MPGGKYETSSLSEPKRQDTQPTCQSWIQENCCKSFLRVALLKYWLLTPFTVHFTMNVWSDSNKTISFEPVHTAPHHHLKTHSFIFVLVSVWGPTGWTPPFPPQSLEDSALFSSEDAVSNAVSAQWHSSLSPQDLSAHKLGGGTFTRLSLSLGLANCSYVVLQLLLL